LSVSIYISPADVAICDDLPADDPMKMVMVKSLMARDIGKIRISTISLEQDHGLAYQKPFVWTIEVQADVSER
jgi:hypothetical protein